MTRGRYAKLAELATRTPPRVLERQARMRSTVSTIRLLIGTGCVLFGAYWMLYHR